MKKIILSLCVGIIIASCSNNSSSDKFVGTWQKQDQSTKIIINKADHDYQVLIGSSSYNAIVNNNVMSFDMPVYGHISLTINSDNNLIFDGYKYNRLK